MKRFCKRFLPVLVCLVLVVSVFVVPSFASTGGYTFYPPANWPWGSIAIDSASAGKTSWEIPYVSQLADGSYQYTFHQVYDNFGEWQQSSETGQFSDAWISSDQTSFSSNMATYGTPFFYYPSWVSTRILLRPRQALVTYKTKDGVVRDTVVTDGLSSVPCSVNYYLFSAQVDGSSAGSIDWTKVSDSSCSASLGAVPSLSFGNSFSPSSLTGLTGVTGFTARISCSSSDFSMFVPAGATVTGYHLYMSVDVELRVPVDAGQTWILSYPDYCYKGGTIVIPEAPTDDLLGTDLPFTDSDEFVFFGSLVADVMSWRLLSNMLSVVLILAVIKYLLY